MAVARLVSAATARMVGAAAVGSGLAAGIDSQTVVICGRSMQPTLVCAPAISSPEAPRRHASSPPGFLTARTERRLH